MQRKTLGVIATSLLVLGSYACGVDAPTAPARAGSDPVQTSAGARVRPPAGAVVHYSGYLVSSGRSAAGSPR